MADRNQEVFDMVASELETDPGASVESLYERAREMDSSIGELSKRQFHARYTLPIKRQRSRAEAGPGTRPKRRRTKGRRGGAGSPSGMRRSAPRVEDRQEPGDRAAVRRVFLEFASDFARAQSKAAVVDVVAQVDDYVERVLRAAGR